MVDQVPIPRKVLIRQVPMQRKGCIEEMVDQVRNERGREGAGVADIRSAGRGGSQETRFSRSPQGVYFRQARHL
jgi:hypothetical protein